jgi:hypothetical protein
MGKRRAAAKIDGKCSVQEIQYQQTPSPRVQGVNKDNGLCWSDSNAPLDI